MDNRTYVVGEIGINANGDIETAKDLITLAKDAGFDCVKFQKRTVDLVYTKEELDKPRESPFGSTNGDLKRALEFSLEQYQEIDRHCKEEGIEWTVSVWDSQSLKDMASNFDLPFIKIPSALLTRDDLLRGVKETGKTIVLATGMSSIPEIDHAVEVVGKYPLVLLHCNSSYPAEDEELNLSCIRTLSERYNRTVGYSGHERGIATTVAAVAMGAKFIERHITLDRTMYGSDQAASLEVNGFYRLIRDIRAVEAAMGDGNKIVWDSELPSKAKLRR